MHYYSKGLHEAIAKHKCSFRNALVKGPYIQGHSLLVKKKTNEQDQIRYMYNQWHR